jgi:uncharacterized protein YggU (UPF0235/DUF167 family)
VSLPDYVSDADGATLVRVRIQPRSRSDEIAGERAGALLVRVTAPPVEGRANAALCRLLAKAAGVPPSSAELVRLSGVAASDAAARLR